MAIALGSCLPSTCRMIDVFAVPGPPTRSERRVAEMERSMLYSVRTSRWWG